MKLLVRDGSGASVLDGLPATAEPYSNLQKLPAGTDAQFAADGKVLGVLGAEGVKLYDSSTGKQTAALPSAGAVAFALSPGGKYVLTFQRHVPGSTEGNLIVWEAATASKVLQVFQKQYLKELWPSVSWSSDTGVACRLVTNEVQFYNASDMAAGPSKRFHIQGVAAVGLSSGDDPFLAAYVPEVKGAPANIRIYQYSAISDDAQPVARRSFFRVSSVRFLWNATATAVLVHASSDVDKTNQSYYGESHLHFLRSDGKNDCAVPLSKEGPIHDVQWSPSGKEFIAVYGFMPAKATLFDEHCKPVFEFGSGPRNVVRWNPHGRFVVLAGFGNLPGDMEFWTRDRTKLLGKTKVRDTVMCQWSPDGRHLMTCTLSPRLRVDNGFKLFTYYGEQLPTERKYESLYQAEWVPEPASAHPDRPPSPGRREYVETNAPTAAKPASYRPPHAGSSSQLNLNDPGDDEAPHRVKPGAAGPPGATVSKAALKNQKRREKKKEGGAGEVQEQVAATTSAMQELEPPSASSQPEASASADGDGDAGKRIRALQKKLRQIEQLKEKQAAGGKMTNPEVTKIATETALLAELKELEGA
eukprot:jgi/Chlat1/4640/Chrsp3S05596